MYWEALSLCKSKSLDFCLSVNNSKQHGVRAYRKQLLVHRYLERGWIQLYQWASFGWFWQGSRYSEHGHCAAGDGSGAGGSLTFNRHFDAITPYIRGRGGKIEMLRPKEVVQLWVDVFNRHDVEAWKSLSASTDLICTTVMSTIRLTSTRQGCADCLR